jgi:hypothetical protein
MSFSLLGRKLPTSCYLRRAKGGLNAYCLAQFLAMVDNNKHKEIKMFYVNKNTNIPVATESLLGANHSSKVAAFIISFTLGATQ